jgi:hypothetical protein
MWQKFQIPQKKTNTNDSGLYTINRYHIAIYVNVPEETIIKVNLH